jgi:TAT (twin-arginine translocation) pathway-exported protein
MGSVDRRSVIKAALAVGAAGLLAPPILTFGRVEAPIKIGGRHFDCIQEEG